MLFQKKTGISLGCYIRNKRLELAQAEIMNGSLITDVAFDVGFNNYSTFYRAYIRYFGYTPSVQPMEKIEVPKKPKRRGFEQTSLIPITAAKQP
jgi:AraC-like DNA-binding protein